MTVAFWQAAFAWGAMAGLALIVVTFFNAVAGDRYSEQFFEMCLPVGFCMLVLFGLISLALKGLL